MTANKKPILEQVCYADQMKRAAEVDLFLRMAEVYWEQCEDSEKFISDLRKAGYGKLADTYQSFLSKDKAEHHDDLRADQSALV